MFSMYVRGSLPGERGSMWGSKICLFLGLLFNVGCLEIEGPLYYEIVAYAFD